MLTWRDIRGMRYAWLSSQDDAGSSDFLPYGSPGQFGVIDMGGMFTILKVREELVDGKAPGWYQHPPGTDAHRVNSRTSSHRH